MKCKRRTTSYLNLPRFLTTNINLLKSNDLTLCNLSPISPLLRALTRPANSFMRKFPCPPPVPNSTQILAQIMVTITPDIPTTICPTQIITRRTIQATMGLTTATTMAQRTRWASTNSTRTRSQAYQKPITTQRTPTIISTNL